MKTLSTTLTGLLLAGGVSLAIAAAPAALAQPHCTETEQGGGEQGGSNTMCQSPGDAELNARPGMLAQGAMGGMTGMGMMGVP
ncbi:hypothetical protein NGTWS0302_24200 [Mycolicibacterium cyprinidarum]|uniref:Intersectin-EH binding protein Ibp1 n=1 Tax=Mycolicibacterium cyprinidarum TaxID=2860311 RepID=A0ABQ4VCS1_9MYCO|nr:hypothetical protein NGTWS0302_24200 [Mycolicibacterium sp. NGTWS0302]GJF13456.1 hypothetical protein NGTWS1803_24870 [Mycolicibacterium sp. NGTWS1803]GJF17132.1 hypothetical protein NGTWS1702_23090 [Mycolicibacterium sp. NGTWSNA01]